MEFKRMIFFDSILLNVYINSNMKNIHFDCIPSGLIEIIMI